MQDDVKTRSAGPGRRLGGMHPGDRERRVSELAEKLFVVAYAKQPTVVSPVQYSQLTQAFAAAEAFVEQVEYRLGLLD